MANKASQREKGIGDFSPSQMAEADVIKELQGKLISEFADPLLDAVGFEGESRKVAQAIFLSKFAGAGGNAGAGSQSSTPDYIGGV